MICVKINTELSNVFLSFLLEPRSMAEPGKYIYPSPLLTKLLHSYRRVSVTKNKQAIFFFKKCIIAVPASHTLQYSRQYVPHT